MVVFTSDRFDQLTEDNEDHLKGTQQEHRYYESLTLWLTNGINYRRDFSTKRIKVALSLTSSMMESMC